MAEFTANQIEEIVSIIANEFSKQATPQETVQGVARGVTQYVGARYVPLFAEPLEWDSTREYEPLTIVLHEGNSYTSRQYVPTGIEIDNDSFWAITGNYNAQVEAYRAEVKAYDVRIKDVEKQSAQAVADAKTANDAVATEKERAVAKETELDTAIKTEASRAQGAEEATNSEVAKNTTAIAANKQAIADEKTERMEDTETLTAQLAGTSDSGLRDLIEEVKKSINTPTEGFTISTGYDMQSKCQWKKFTFPKSKYPLRNLRIDLAMEQYITDVNYYKWLEQKNEGVYFNGALQGTAVSNSQVIYNAPVSESEYWYLLLIKDGVVSVRKDINRTVTATDLVYEGYNFACGVWLPVVLEGVKFDTTNIPNSDKNYTYIIDRKHPRTLFAWDNNNWYVVIIEGRGYINLGANFNEMYNICNSLNISNAVNMDGGHSCQVWSTAPTFNYVYQNSSTKPYGFASGNIFAFISAHE